MEPVGGTEELEVGGDTMDATEYLKNFEAVTNASAMLDSLSNAPGESVLCTTSAWALPTMTTTTGLSGHLLTTERHIVA